MTKDQSHDGPRPESGETEVSAVACMGLTYVQAGPPPRTSPEREREEVDLPLSDIVDTTVVRPLNNVIVVSSTRTSGRGEW